MPTNPVDELIAQNIATAISEITVANSYNYDLTAARPTRIGFDGMKKHKDLTVLIVQDDADADESKASEGNPPMLAWRQPFMLIAYVIESDASTDPIDQRINRVRADIIKKLMDDVTRGGYAHNTTFVGSQVFASSPGVSGVVLYVDIEYRVRSNDPYTQA